MIDPSALDPFSLPSVSLQDREKLPKEPAVYFAISEVKEILYIGKAVCLHDRWVAHHRMRNIALFDHARIAWYSMGDDTATTRLEMTKLESACIKYFKPKLNHTVIPEEVSGTAGVSIRLPKRTQQRLLEISEQTGMDMETALIMAIEHYRSEVKKEASDRRRGLFF